MEMQQTEIFATQLSKMAAGSHLRLVQPIERRGIVGGASQTPVLQTSRAAVRPGRPEGGLRGISPEHVERFLNHLRGEALLVGALCYDLGLRLSQLRFLRIRDVNLTARVIEFSEGAKVIPPALFEDLRDHISEKVCGRGGSVTGQKRDQLLFSHQAFEEVLRICLASFAEAQREANDDGASALRISIVRRQQDGREGNGGERKRVRDNFLRVMGWFHTKRASKRGGRVASPLGLFDKGPKIVRRDRGGIVHSYYLWRAVYSR